MSVVIEELIEGLKALKGPEKKGYPPGAVGRI